MFGILLLGLAAAAARDASSDADERPSISIGLSQYNLGEAQDVRRLQRAIGQAANRVCTRGYGIEMYVERVACVKSAISEANHHVQQLLAMRHSDSPLSAAAVSVSAAEPSIDLAERKQR